MRLSEESFRRLMAEMLEAKAVPKGAFSLRAGGAAARAVRSATAGDDDRGSSGASTGPSHQREALRSMDEQVDVPERGGEQRQPRQRWQWPLAAVAAALAVTIVAGLTYVRFSSGGHPGVGLQTAGQAEVLSSVDFRCQLPLAGARNAGFLSLPEGKVALDPSVKPSPGGKGGYAGAGPAYTYSGGLWLQGVPPQQISPDHKAVAYPLQISGVPGQQPTGTIVLANAGDVAAGNRKFRELWSTEGMPTVIGYTSGGIYVAKNAFPIGPGPLPGPEVWVIEPARPGSAHKIGPNPAISPLPNEGSAPGNYLGPSSSWVSVAGGVAWGMGYSRMELPKQSPPPGAPAGWTGPKYVPVPDHVLRMDVRDGGVSTYYTAPAGKVVTVAGTDAQGRPIVILNSVGPFEKPPVPVAPQVLLLTGVNQTAQIGGDNKEFTPMAFGGMGGGLVADSHGVWFSTPGAIWLYSQSGGLRKIARIPEGLFPSPSPPPGFAGQGASSSRPNLPPGYPAGAQVLVAGACT